MIIPSHQSRCLHCDTELLGSYCHVCGEKRFSRNDLVLKSFAKNFITSFTEIDGKFIQSIKMLVVAPGELTHAFVNGRKARYVKPFVLFAILNFIFFLIQPLGNLNTFNSTLFAQMHWNPYSEYVERIVLDHLQDTQETLDNYSKRFNILSEQYAKTFVGFQIPLAALLVWILEIKKKRYFVEHMIFTTHFYSMFLLFDITSTLIILGLLRTLDLTFNLEYHIMFALIVYYSVALRKVYSDGWVAAVLKSIVLSMGFLGILMVYRFVLFFATFYSL